MKSKNNLFKACILISIAIVVLEVYRWSGWDVDFEEWTLWTFITNKGNTGMLWNLLLGWIAVLFSWLVCKMNNRILVKFLSLVWILWLPNTIYMVTDLKYFRADKTTALWHEVLFYTLFGLIGIFLFVLSVYLVWLKYRFNKKWMAIITGLSIVGVVAGRVLRWNSWDIFTAPQKILTDIINLF